MIHWTHFKGLASARTLIYGLLTLRVIATVYRTTVKPWWIFIDD